MTDLKILPQKVKGSNKRDENKPEKTHVMLHSLAFMLHR